MEGLNFYRFRLWVLAAVFFTGGCAGVLCPAGGRYAVDNRGAGAGGRQQQSSGRFQIVTSLLFKYRFLSIAGLCYTAVDEAAGTLDTVGFNPAGIKIVEAHSRGGKTTGDFAFKTLARGADVPTRVAFDARRIYFNRVPGESAGRRRQNDKTIFRRAGPDGALYWVFDRQDRLVRKYFYAGRRLLWRVDYNGYIEKDKKLYCENIVLRDYRYHYKLIVRLKEVQ